MMAVTLRTGMLSLAALAAVLMGSIQADAGEKLWPPAQGCVVPVPRLGFSSYYQNGSEHVTAVRNRSLAWEIGLEPGDRVYAVNGRRLRYNGHWYSLMRRAAAEGYITLAIRDWRTGRTAYRNIDLGGGSQITPKR